MINVVIFVKVLGVECRVWENKIFKWEGEGVLGREFRREASFSQRAVRPYDGG